MLLQTEMCERTVPQNELFIHNLQKIMFQIGAKQSGLLSSFHLDKSFQVNHCVYMLLTGYCSGCIFIIQSVYSILKITVLWLALYFANGLSSYSWL